MRYYQFEFGVDGYVSLGSRYGWVLTINQLYPYLPFIFRSRARNGRFKKVFSCFVFNFFIEVLKTHVVLDYLNPAYQAAARPASFTRVFRAYYLGQSYLTVGFLFDRSAIRRLAGWTKMDPSQAEPKEISFPLPKWAEPWVLLKIQPWQCVIVKNWFTGSTKNPILWSNDII